MSVAGKAWTGLPWMGVSPLGQARLRRHGTGAAITAALFLVGCGQQQRAIQPDQVAVERSSSPTIPVVVYEVPAGAGNANVSEWSDQHGRVCTLVSYNGPAIDCDFRPAAIEVKECVACKP